MNMRIKYRRTTGSRQERRRNRVMDAKAIRNSLARLFYHRYGCPITGQVF